MESFFSRRSCLAPLDLAFQWRRQRHLFWRLPFDFLHPPCISTMPEDSNAVRGGQDSRRPCVVSCESQRAPSAVEAKSPRRRPFASFDAVRNAVKPRPWVYFGSVGEMTAGPRHASTAAGVTTKHVLDDTSDQATQKPLRLRLEHGTDSIRALGRGGEATTRRGASTPTLAGPTPTAQDRGDRLPDPTPVSSSAATPAVIGAFGNQSSLEQDN